MIHWPKPKYETTTDVCSKYCGLEMLLLPVVATIFARFDLILFADLHFLVAKKIYLAFAHFFPCHGQTESRVGRDGFLFENFSNLALMMECACSILKITTNKIMKESFTKKMTRAKQT